MLEDTSLAKELIGEMRHELIRDGTDESDEEVKQRIEDLVLYDTRTCSKAYHEKKDIVQYIFNALRRELDVLEPLAEDEDINEIMVNGPEKVFVERHGRLEPAGVKFEDTEHLEEIIRRVVAKVHREINELTPIVDARLDDGSRVNAVYKNIALGGPVLTIRKFPKTSITMEDLIRSGTVNKESAVFLKTLVECGYNIFISGGTSSGKTTFLNVLSACIPSEERIIVIEDSVELQITTIPNIVRMETRNANVQGRGEVSMRSLIKTALRMRPSRIIVGEVRGEEVLDMIQAMNTGHDGSLSTGHANSPAGMISRMEAMFLSAVAFPIEAVRNQICEAIDIIVHMGRVGESRRVIEITEVEGYIGGQVVLNPLYKARQTEDGLLLQKTKSKLKNKEKWERVKGVYE